MMPYSATTSLYNTLPAQTAVNGEYLYWFPYWQMIRDCLMGEIMVKSRGTQYLPRLQTHTDDEYRAYIARATFYNTTARTVSGLVGAIHARSPLIEGAPLDMLSNPVTSDGQSFDMFMHKVSTEIVSVGRYGVMIDAPIGGGDAYLVGYRAEDICDWLTDRDGSRERLVYVVLRETKRARRPFTSPSQDMLEQYRVLFIDSDGIYKQRVYQNGIVEGTDYEEVVPTMQGRLLTEIPFLFIGPYDFGYDIEKPPMLDIALLNLSHYRSYAMLEQGRHYTATPVYSVFLSGGGDDDADYQVGPNIVWQLGGQDKAEILEFKGDGLKYLENALTTKEQQIASLGGKLSSQPSGVAAESADAVMARVRGEASFLGSVITTMNEAGSRILSALALWNGAPANARVTYSSEATEIYLDGREIRAMAMLYDTGLLPMETIFAIFRQNNIIPTGISFEEFKSMLPETPPKVVSKVTEHEGKTKIDAQYADQINPPVPPRSESQNQA